MAILGIVDQSGKLVVKYKYDAYCNNLVMYVDSTGDFAISALIIVAIIGACIGFGATAYIDSKDGQMFNGDVKWYDYLVATALGGVVGAGICALATIAFTAWIY